MCRLYGFRSAIDSGVHESLIAAENAMAMQSERHQDGWGIAYYLDRFPHVIRNDQQALKDSLFGEISAVVSTKTFIAHIRQATAGDVRVLNCHPFQYGQWIFAHNGEICNYADPEIRAKALELVDIRFRRFIMGNTDSEVSFYAFLSRLARRVADLQSPGVRAAHVVDALRETVQAITQIAPDEGVERPNRLNFMITNGNVLVANRFRRDLYFSTYKTLCPERESCWAYEKGRCESEVTDGIVKHLLVSSEVISQGTNVWKPMVDNDYVCVDHGMNFHQGKLLPDWEPDGA